MTSAPTESNPTAQVANADASASPSNGPPDPTTSGGPPKKPACPRCGKPTGLRLDHPPGPYNDVYRCDGRLAGCGYLWSPKSA